MGETKYERFDSKHYYLAKGVKDFILLTGKLEFSFEELKEIIETNAALNYCNDLYLIILKKVWK